MPKRRYAAIPLIAVAALMVLLLLVVYGMPLNSSAIWLGFITGMALLSSLRLYLPHGESISLASTLMTASLVLFAFPSGIYMMAAGTLIAIPFVAAIRRNDVVIEGARHVFAGGVAFWVYQFRGGTTMAGGVDGLAAGAPILFLSLFVVYHVVDFSMEEFGLRVFRKDARLSFQQSFELMKLLGPAHVALISVGILTAILWEPLGFWSIALVVGMLLLFRHSLRLYVEVAKAYDDTIKALAKAVDVHESIDGPSAEQVEVVARSLGRELRLTRSQLDILSRAALLVNLGKIGLDDPELDAGGIPVHHSSRAARILRQSEGLKLVGRLVEHQDIHYDRLPLPPHEILLTQCLFVSRIWCQAMMDGESPNSVKKLMKRESRQMFHPKVVRALQVLHESGALDTELGENQNRFNSEVQFEKIRVK